jgi:hypothetical protein
MADLVSATYDDERQAQRAVDALIGAGVPLDDITVLAPGGPDSGGAMVDATVSTEEERPDEEIGAGMAVGGLLGLAAANAGLGVGGAPAAAGQPLATPAGGVVAGAMAGALLGAAYEGLVHLGLDEDAARLYERRLRAGDTVVIVRPRGIGPERARELLEEHGGADVRGA